MSIWKPNNVSQEPASNMTEWGIIEIENKTAPKTYHVCGYCGEGRMSSKIIHVELNETGYVTTTRSGRRYLLNLDYFGLSVTGDAWYVLGQWLKINNLTISDCKHLTIEEVREWASIQ